MTSDEQAIRDVIAAWTAASETGDTQALLGLMTDDVVFTAVGRPRFGKEAFAVAAIGQRATRIEAPSDIRELRVSGAFACVWN